jgi:hypothetical protein
VKSSDIAVSSA